MTIKVLILGGGGFIGSWVADRLLDEGHAVRIFARSDVVPYRRFGAEQVEWMTGDLLNIRDVRTAVGGVDVVIHLVSTTLPKSSNDNPLYDMQSNVAGTLNLLKEMVTQNVRKIVFSSSGGTVYGTPRYIPVDELHPTDPIVSHGITKLAIEKYISMFETLHGLQGIVLRIGNPFGERQRADRGQGAVGVFLHRALSGQIVEIWGDGSCTRDYLYVGDVAEAFAKAVSYEGSGIFNISSGKGTSLNELLNEIEAVLGTQIHRRYLPSRPFDVPASILAISLARRELQWTPHVPLRAGLLRTIEWTKRCMPVRSAARVEKSESFPFPSPRTNRPRDSIRANIRT
jgi:UDP-glucose 4-epimerase